MPALFSLAQRFRIHIIEKTRRIPAAGFRSGGASLYRLGQGQFAPDHSSQTNQAGAQQAQGARFGNRKAGVATGHAYASTEVALARVDSELNCSPNSARPV